MSRSTQPASDYNNNLENLDKFDKNEMSGGPLTIEWTSERIDCLLDWLEQNVQKRHLLFSDSQEDANKESRKKGQAKPSKSCIMLGHTGAGLTFDQLEGNPDYKGPIGMITAKFKIFNRLHGFWQKIPNFNLFTTLSDPDQDYKAQAFDIFFDPNAASLFPGAYHQSLSSLFQTNHSSHSFGSSFDNMQAQDLQGLEIRHLQVHDVPFQDIPFQLPSSPVSGSVSGHSGFFMNQAPTSPALGHSSFYASIPPGFPSSGQSGFSANPSTNLIVKSGKQLSAVTVRETLWAQLATLSGKEVSAECLITTDRRISMKDTGTPQSAKVDDRPHKQPRSYIEDNMSLMQKVMEPVAQAMQGQQSLAQEALSCTKVDW
ncbi:hypothetical protein SERLA73DRAFT_157390 [Serpula lacrymans var. lacrymans S7.3]|uniref:Uncharacterized protein n=1 Tax=Serpula lacrymans var. lacrymans (strain S7.3) TaxID=936435 RepID=F8QIT3_SERL3|nr:hypothetical protein SERLA73DRAFT_157390 [Serpula lacrymans var. lacrymans S7.3]